MQDKITEVEYDMLSNDYQRKYYYCNNCNRYFLKHSFIYHSCDTTPIPNYQELPFMDVDQLQ